MFVKESIRECEVSRDLKNGPRAPLGSYFYYLINKNYYKESYNMSEGGERASNRGKPIISSVTDK